MEAVPSASGSMFIGSNSAPGSPYPLRTLPESPTSPSTEYEIRPRHAQPKTAIVRVSDSVYQICRFKEISLNKSMTKDLQTLVSIDSPGVEYILNKGQYFAIDLMAFSRASFDPYSDTSNLSPKQRVLAKYGIDHTFVTATVVAKHLYRKEVIVRYENGTARNLQYFEIIHSPNTMAALTSLPIVKPSKKRDFTKYFLFGCSLAELVLFVCLLIFGGRYADTTDTDSAYLSLIQLFAVVLSIILNLKSIHILTSLRADPHNTLYWLVSYKMITMLFMDYYSILMPNTIRTILVIAGIMLRIIQIAYILQHPKFLNFSSEMQEEIMSHFDTEFGGQRSNKKSSWIKRMIGLEREESFAESVIAHKSDMPNVRISDSVIHERNFTKGKYFTAFGISFILFLLPYLFIETWRILSNSNPLLNSSELTDIQTSFENVLTTDTAYTNTNLKVVMVLMDGMRYDSLTQVDAFAAMMSNATVKTDSLTFKMHTQLPSMSVPNWLNLLSGVPPVASGLNGNLGIVGTNYETIFTVCKRFNLTTALTGSAWFSELLSRSVQLDIETRQQSSVTIGAYVDAFSTKSTLADLQRTSVLSSVTSGNTSVPKFFLTHFSDIDEQGHLYGVSPTFNKNDSYHKAITSKVYVLNNLITQLDNDTVLMIVADHGQAYRGGHGGTDPNILEVPLIVYKKGSNLSQYAATDEPMFSSVNFAATVCALLGVPPPSTSYGSYIDKVLNLLSPSAKTAALQKLSVQQNNFATYLNTRLGSDSIDPTQLNTIGMMSYATSALENANLSQNSFITKLSTAYQSVQIGNLIISIIWFVLSFVAFTTYLYHTTPLRTIKTFAFFWTYKNRNSVQFFIQLIWNWIAPKLEILTWTIISIGGYHTLTNIIFFVYWIIYGYNVYAFESTIIHHPRMLLNVFLSIMIPGICVEVFWMRIVLYFTEKRLWKIDFTKLSQGGKPVFAGWRKLTSLFCKVMTFTFDPIDDNPVLTHAVAEVKPPMNQPTYFHHERFLSNLFVYQIQVYSFLGQALYIFVLLIMSSSFSSLVTFLPRAIPYISPDFWDMRFRVLVMVWIALPSTIGKVLLIAVRLGRMEFLPLFLQNYSGLQQNLPNNTGVLNTGTGSGPSHLQNSHVNNTNNMNIV